MSMDAAGTYLYLFGGQGFDAGTTSGFLSDLWRYDFASGWWAWVSGSTVRNTAAVFGVRRVPATSNLPVAVEGAFMAPDVFNAEILWLHGKQARSVE